MSDSKGIPADFVIEVEDGCAFDDVTVGDIAAEVWEACPEALGAYIAVEPAAADTGYAGEVVAYPLMPGMVLGTA